MKYAILDRILEQKEWEKIELEKNENSEYRNIYIGPLIVTNLLY